MIKKIYNPVNHTVLHSENTINLSKKLITQINLETHVFSSGTPTIIELPNEEYLINMRWINYKLNKHGILLKVNVNHNIKNLNSRFKVNKLFQPISKEIFLDEEFTHKSHMEGIEDIRIFYFNDTYYYNATIFDTTRNIASTTVEKYPIHDNVYKLNRLIIIPTHYNTNKLIIPEKNWSFVNYNNELCIIHLWFPLQIGKINDNQLKIIETKKMPEYFKYARGTSAGYTKNNEIWFVLHKTQDKNYVHFFAIFDLQMKLLRYSQTFKFKNYKVEFCLGLIVQDRQVILSYSVMDTQSFISVYPIKYLQNLKWY